MFKDISTIDNSLRPYQQQAKEEIFSSWDLCDNVMFQMPTGTGKTRLFTSVISDIRTWGVQHLSKVKILIIAHRIELIEQISDNLNRYHISHGIIAGGMQRNLNQSVQVASIQTITHRTNIDVARSLNVSFIIIDEAHHCVANSYKKLWTLYPNSKKLGVTATPWRMNNRGFADLFDNLIVSQPIQEYINKGWLSPFDYYSISQNSEIQKQIDAIDEFDFEGDYKVSALERQMDTMQIRAQLLKSYIKFAKGKKGIIYSISRKHSDHICSEYRAAGVSIVRIDSLTPKEERRLYVERFKKGQIDIIVNVDIFSEGFDCPDIEFIQLARPTKSLVKYLQQVGRGLRPTPSHSRCIILDNVGLHFTFGLPNAERNWEESFMGDAEEAQCKRKSDNERSSSSGLGSGHERDLSEGDEEMELIDSVAVSKWSRDDYNLLETLVSRHCSISIIASVFKTSTQIIEKRISQLNSIC